MSTSGTEKNTPPSTKRTSRGARKSSTWTLPFSMRVGQVLLALILVGMPWFFGGAIPSIQAWIFVAVGIALVWSFIPQVRSDSPFTPMPAVFIPLFLAATLGLLQLVPMPVGLLRHLSPRGAKMWSELNADVSPVPASEGRVGFDLGQLPSSGRSTISLYPQSTRENLSWLILAVAFFFLGVFLCSTQKQPILLLGVIAMLGAAIAFFGMAQQLASNGKIYGVFELSDGGVPFGPFVNRNNAGGFLGLCLACAIGSVIWIFSQKSERRGSEAAARVLASPLLRDHRTLAWAARRLAAAVSSVANFNGTKLLGLIALFLISVAIVCCMSRGAWFAAIAGVIAIAVALAARRRLWSFVLLVIPVGLVCVGLIALLDRGPSIHERFETVRTGEAFADARLDHWRDGLATAKSFLLSGSGLGTYRFAYLAEETYPHSRWFYHAENQYIEALTEMGLPGLSLFLVCIGLVGFACFRLLLERTSSASYACGVAGLFALANQVVAAFFDFGLYIPANMALMAVLCGAVCGRAARQAYRHDRRKRQKTAYRLRTALLVLPYGHTLALMGTVLLLVGVAWGLMQVAAGSTVADVLKKHPVPTSFHETSLTEINDQICQVGSAVKRQPGNAEVRRRLAQLWLVRYRLEAHRAMTTEEMDEKAKENQWELTAPIRLHEWVRRLMAEGRNVELEDLRKSPEVQIPIANACRCLLDSRRASPLFADIHLLLAELTPVLSSDATESVHLARTLELVGANPDLLAESGLVALQSGLPEVTLTAWERCVELDATRFPKFLRIALNHPDLSASVDQLFPSSPRTIIDGVVSLRETETTAELRRRMLAKARDLASHGTPVDEGERHYLLGRIFSLENQSVEAVEQYSIAVELRPQDTQWRYELAMLLESDGRIGEAREQMARCVRSAPHNETYEAKLRELIRFQLTTPE